jgi:TatD DNase family protein
MLELADAHGKPVVVHDREAHDEVIAELQSWAQRQSDGGAAAKVDGRPRGVLHCFSGDAHLAAAAERLDMLCSFAGTVTFPRSEPIREAAAGVTERGYVVETDAPFLAPVPHRGRPNLPGYVAATAAAVAALRQEEPAAVARASTANARRLFGLPDPAGGDRVAPGPG